MPLPAPSLGAPAPPATPVVVFATFAASRSASPFNMPCFKNSGTSVYVRGGELDGFTTLFTYTALMTAEKPTSGAQDNITFRRFSAAVWGNGAFIGGGSAYRTSLDTRLTLAPGFDHVTFAGADDGVVDGTVLSAVRATLVTDDVAVERRRAARRAAVTQGGRASIVGNSLSVRHGAWCARRLLALRWLLMQVLLLQLLKLAFAVGGVSGRGCNPWVWFGAGGRVCVRAGLLQGNSVAKQHATDVARRMGTPVLRNRVVSEALKGTGEESGPPPARFCTRRTRAVDRQGHDFARPRQLCSPLCCLLSPVPLAHTGASIAADDGATPSSAELVRLEEQGDLARLHDRDPTLEATSVELSNAVEHREPTTPPLSTHNFQLFKQMQLVTARTRHACRSACVCARVGLFSNFASSEPPCLLPLARSHTHTTAYRRRSQPTNFARVRLLSELQRTPHAAQTLEWATTRVASRRYAFVAPCCPVLSVLLPLLPAPWPCQRPRVPLTPLQYAAKMLPASSQVPMLESASGSSANVPSLKPSGLSFGLVQWQPPASGLTVEFGPPPVQALGSDQLVLHQNLYAGSWHAVLGERGGWGWGGFLGSMRY